MSWLNKILDNHFYVVVDPEIYYEWEHMGSIPNDTKFRYGNIRNIKTLDKIAVSVESPDIVKKDREYLSINSIPITCAKFVSGSTKNKEEILNGYKELKSRLQRELGFFKDSAAGRGYFVRNDRIYEINKFDNDNVLLTDHGKWEDIIKSARAAQMRHPQKPGGFKAGDLTDLHKLTTSLMSADNRIPFDRSKMSILLKNCGTETRQQEMKWFDLFCEIDKNASRLQDKISRLEKLSWIKNM